MSDVKDKLTNPEPITIDASFTDMARSLGRVEGMQRAQGEALVHIVERLDTLTDNKLDRSTFWKVFAAAQSVVTGAISYIVTQL